MANDPQVNARCKYWISVFEKLEGEYGQRMDVVFTRCKGAELDQTVVLFSAQLNYQWTILQDDDEYIIYHWTSAEDAFRIYTSLKDVLARVWIQNWLPKEWSPLETGRIKVLSKSESSND